MNINEILTQAKINGTEGAQTAIDSLRKIVNEHETAVIVAMDAYYAGAVKVEDTVKQRLSALEAQQRRINSEITAMGPALTQATVSGDGAQLKQIQAKLSELEAQKAATATQIEILNTSLFPSDTKLYKEAAACREKQLSALNEVSEVLGEICSYVRAQITAWEAVLTRAGACSTRDELMRRYTAMHDDYHSKEMIRERLARREQEDAKKAARAAAVERQKAMFAEMDRKEQERHQREAANRPEFITQQNPGVTIRYRLNHQTGEYEEVGRQSNCI